MPSGKYFFIAHFGLYMAGAVAVNTLSQDEMELTEMATNLGCAAIIVQDIHSSGTGFPTSEIIRIQLSIKKKDHSQYDFAADLVSLLKMAVPKNVSLSDMPADARVTMMLTSGSTGVQKLVTHTHSTLLYWTSCSAKGFQYKSSDVLVNDRPMQWIGGYPILYLGGGSTLVYVVSQLARAKYDAFFVDVVASENPTSSFMIEYRVIGISSQPDLLYKMPRLQSVTVSGQRVTANNIRQILKFSDEVKVVYSSTESCDYACIICQETDSYEDGTVGTFGLGTESKIVDDEGVIVPVGEVGELHVRSEISIKEYVSLDGKIRNILDGDNWYHTEDMATMNSDGVVIIKGRKTEMIKRATVKLFPAVIERKLHEHLDVQEVVVVAIPHQRLHQEVCACIILKSGSTVTMEDIREKADDIFKPSLAPDGLGSMPGHFLIMDDFPRTISSKCARFRLAIKAAAALQQND